jgi:hypothetical protein
MKFRGTPPVDRVSAHRTVSLPTRYELIAVACAALLLSGLLLHRWLAVITSEIPDAALMGNWGWGAAARLILYVLT